MTDTQLCLSIGIPTFAVIVSLIAMLAQMAMVNRRIDDLRDSVNRRFDDVLALIRSEIKRLDDRFDRLERPIVRP